jgi:hypothetical protein
MLYLVKAIKSLLKVRVNVPGLVIRVNGFIFFANQFCSCLQGQKKSAAVGFGALFHDQLFSILFIFTGIFLVNYVLVSSAAAESTNTLLLSFQDVVELMNQVSTSLSNLSPSSELSFCYKSYFSSSLAHFCKTETWVLCRYL